MKFSDFLKPFRQSSPEDSQSGMTIIEILIVIALIGTIMTIVISNIIKSADRAKEDLTRTAQAQIKSSLMLYRSNVNRYPSTDQGLAALIRMPDGVNGWRGPYSEEDKIKDAWQNEMQYELISGNVYKITSPGIDSEFGTDDDIVFPKELGEKQEQAVSTELTVPTGQKEVR